MKSDRDIIMTILDNDNTMTITPCSNHNHKDNALMIIIIGKYDDNEYDESCDDDRPLGPDLLGLLDADADGAPAVLHEDLVCLLYMYYCCYYIYAYIIYNEYLVMCMYIYIYIYIERERDTHIHT